MEGEQGREGRNYWMDDLSIHSSIHQKRRGGDGRKGRLFTFSNFSFYFFLRGWYEMAWYGTVGLNEGRRKKEVKIDQIDCLFENLGVRIAYLPTYPRLTRLFLHFTLCTLHLL